MAALITCIYSVKRAIDVLFFVDISFYCTQGRITFLCYHNQTNTKEEQHQQYIVNCRGLDGRSPMSPVKFKKRLFRPVSLKGQGPHYKKVRSVKHLGG